MSVFQSEDRLRLKRLRSEKAIQLAMQNRWEEAADLNRQERRLSTCQLSGVKRKSHVQPDFAGRGSG